MLKKLQFIFKSTLLGENASSHILLRSHLSTGISHVRESRVLGTVTGCRPPNRASLGLPWPGAYI